MRRSLTYPIVGALLAAGAPVGLLLVRLVNGGSASRRWLREEVAGDLATYAYVTLATTAVHMVLGRALGVQADRLTELSMIDALTGLSNPREFDRRLRQELARASRSLRPLSVLLIDVDGLKALNDQQGHAAGDRALRGVAEAMRTGLRLTDVAARVGGDEFALIAPDTAPDAALALAERIRARASREFMEIGCGVTVSAGVATFNPAVQEPPVATELIKGADSSLYAAKRAGGNRVRASWTNSVSLSPPVRSRRR